jgi:glycosyltransferase involved in cell wall biosynthesis
MLKFNRSQPIPILVLSDAPEEPSGLARVARDTADLLVSMPEFRVATLGRGAVGKRGYSWMQYSYPANGGQWGEQHIETVWEDFSGGQPGIIWSNWDLSRLLWFSQPRGTGTALETFLGAGRGFEKWLYTPIDATGPSGSTLPVVPTASAMGFDRVIAASEWGRDVLVRSGRADADWLPHGIWFDRFVRTPNAKDLLGWEGKIVAGVNMTNQARKDWPAAFEACAVMANHYGNRFHAWFHTDVTEHYWSFNALAADYGLGAGCVTLTTSLTDHQMAVHYSGCDVTLLPSGGEGFGYPIAESMACGVPAVVTDYAAGQELVPLDACRIRPVAYRIDTQFNVRRAVNSGYAFAQAAIAAIEWMAEDPIGRAEQLRYEVSHLDWTNLQHPWRRWFKEGLTR